MRELAAEEKTQRIEIVQQSLRVFANSAMSSTPASLKSIVNMLNPVEGNTIWAIREVANWLEEKKNQGLNSWGKSWPHSARHTPIWFAWHTRT